MYMLVIDLLICCVFFAIWKIAGYVMSYRLYRARVQALETVVIDLEKQVKELSTSLTNWQRFVGYSRAPSP